MVTVLGPVISVSKSADDTVPHLGQILTYSVIVTNEPVANGADARDVSVVDMLPQSALLDPDSIFINGSPVAGNNNVTDLSSGNTLALSFDNIAYGQEMVISYQALLTADTTEFGASVDNTVSVEWSTLSGADTEDGFDDAARDHTDGLVTSAVNSVTLTAPDYQLTKSSSANSPLNAGDSLNYTLQVTNVGTHEGTGVVISDQFPAEALGAPTFISSGGLYDSSTGLISWEIPALAVNESVTLTVESVVANPQNANIDGLSESADDEFSNSASVTDDGLNGGDPNPDNNADSVTDQIIAAPDYVIGKTSDTTMVAPTEQISYVITAGNVGTQTGTNVVITDVFPVDILTIVDPAGGTVDASNGTIIWNINEFEVGQTETFTIIAEVLPTANLDTADQLFTNSVSITDDTSNGTDPTPDNNEASESDMLLAGAGEPLFLLALPETVGAPPVSISSTIEFEPGTVREVPNTARILTTDFMKGREEGEEIPTRIGENDILSGGDLLDEYSVRAPEIHCAPHFVSYDYQSDPSNLELLDWLQEPSAEDKQSDNSGNGTDESNEPGESNSDSQAAYDGVKAGVDPAAENTLHNSETEPATTSLQQQIQREAKNLYGSGKEELLEAFKDSV